MGLVELIILVVIIVLIFWLLTKYVVPSIPAPWGTVVLLVIALIVVLYLLNRIGVLNL